MTEALRKGKDPVSASLVPSSSIKEVDMRDHQEEGWSTLAPRNGTKAKQTVDGSGSSGIGCNNKFKGLDTMVEDIPRVVVHSDTGDPLI